MARAEDIERAAGPLPHLDALREQVPPEILGLMEELFRAKLTRVVRVPPAALKTAAPSPRYGPAPIDEPVLEDPTLLETID